MAIKAPFVQSEIWRQIQLGKKPGGAEAQIRKAEQDARTNQATANSKVMLTNNNSSGK